MTNQILLDEVRSKSIITPDIREEAEIKKVLNLDIPKDACLMIRCERLVVDNITVGYDTVGYFYGYFVEKVIDGNNETYKFIEGMEKMNFYKYYKKENGEWVSIGPDEYRNRVVRHEKRQYEAFWGNVHKQR